MYIYYLFDLTTTATQNISLMMKISKISKEFFLFRIESNEIFVLKTYKRKQKSHAVIYVNFIKGNNNKLQRK